MNKSFLQALSLSFCLSTVIGFGVSNAQTGSQQWITSPTVNNEPTTINNQPIEEWKIYAKRLPGVLRHPIEYADPVNPSDSPVPEEEVMLDALLQSSIAHLRNRK